MLYQRHEFYRYVLSLKNRIDWTSVRPEKMSKPQECRFCKGTKSIFLKSIVTLRDILSQFCSYNRTQLNWIGC